MKGSRYAVTLLNGVQKRVNSLKRKTDSEPNMKRRSCRKSVIRTDTRPHLGTKTEARKLRFFSLGRKEFMSCWIHLSKFGIAARPGHVCISESIQPREVIPGHLPRYFCLLWKIRLNVPGINDHETLPQSICRILKRNAVKYRVNRRQKM